MSFLKNEDYNVLIRTEIKNILLDKSGADSQFIQSKLLGAEQMAIAQIKNYLSGFYDVEKIFTQKDDQRNAFIVMICLDCTLYHLYSSLSPNKIPVHRSERYADALDWLKNISKGTASADLPQKMNDNGQANSSIKIASNYKTQKNKY